MLTGENGILTKASEAKALTEESQKKEELEMALSQMAMNYTLNGGTGTFSDYIFANGDTLKSILGESNVTLDSEAKTITYKGTLFQISEDGKVTKVDGIGLSESSKTLTISGSTKQEATIKATLFNITGNIEWTSSKPEVATVTGNGETATVKAVGEGTTTITAKCSGKTATCEITVKRLSSTISVNPTTAKVVIGNTTEITVTQDGAEEIVWSSSDNSKATVVKKDANTATVTGVVAGTATITAQTKESNIKAECTVTIAPAIPDGMKVGSEVTYSPSGTYNWQGKYCSTSQSDTTLNSASGQSYNITKWKVLSIENGKVELVPTSPTSGTVYLGQAQGYNNGVKLLNDACSSLYGNTSKGITARSLNIDDIEKYMLEAKLTEAHSYTNAAKYGNQVSSAYTSNKYYPVIYAEEKLSVINGNKKTTGLGMSEQTRFIEKTDGGASNGILNASTSIQPYQTYWYKDNSYMQTAFRTVEGGANYYNLLINTSRNYWLASRCVDTYLSYCYFYMRSVSSGGVNACYMCSSGNGTGGNSLALFPVVSLSSSLLSGNATSGYTVN